MKNISFCTYGSCILSMDHFIWYCPVQVYLGWGKAMAQIEIKNIRLEPDFEPSMKSLLRLMKVMTENGAEDKTKLSLDTNLNYARLTKHVIWLEKKGFVESTVEYGKIIVTLTANGKEFASMILKTS